MGLGGEIIINCTQNSAKGYLSSREYVECAIRPKKQGLFPFDRHVANVLAPPFEIVFFCNMIM